MTEAKFTRGPWIFYADLPSTDPTWHIVTTANKMRTLANVHIEPGNSMDVANALLIAASPDMWVALEAQENAEKAHANCPDCEGIDYWAECGRCSELFGTAIDLRRAALAKAEGRNA